MENYLRMDNKQLADHFGRSETSIQVMMSKLKLRRPMQEWVPVNRPSLQMHIAGLCGKLEAKLEFALQLLDRK